VTLLHPDRSADSPVAIRIDEVSKSFGGTRVLDRVSMTIAPGRLTALLGPSGSGKTTLLRVIAGLERQTGGIVAFDGVDADRLTLRDRRVGFVFQHYALFRHMTVSDNIAFGLRVRPRRERPDRQAIARKVSELLELMQLQGLERRFPAQLSGGQRQRVAIARALAIEPTVLLLDEPFGALDAKVRKDLRRWLREVCERAQVTTVFVTHDQEEALELADGIAIMNRGRIEQSGSPMEVFEDPRTPFVCEFLGNVNRFDCTYGEGYVEVCGAQFPVDWGGRGAGIAYIRAHEFEVVAREHAEGVPAIVDAVHPFGDAVALEVRVEDRPRTVAVSISRELWELGEIRKGDGILVRPNNVRVFRAAS